jgi:hypothetical protein
MTWLGILGSVLAAVWAVEIVAVLALSFGQRAQKSKPSSVTASA